MKIPVQNIYYLLCYAWDKLDEKDRVSVSVDNNTELIDLFAKVLANATKLLLKRGIDKSYVDHTEEIVGLKGKVELGQTLKANLLYKQRTICTYDKFSSDIITNSILVSTISRLVRTRGLDKVLNRELVILNRALSDIPQIEITSSTFKQVRLHRNNRFYGFIINVCQIIHESTLPTEEKGIYSFSDFSRDDKKMNQLFESFIRNFYKIEQRKYTIVKKERISWQFDCTDSESNEHLPIMETDITLENDTEKIIIDAKYYQESMTVNFGNEKIKSANLYQLFSYLMNQRGASPKNSKATGILLYPTVNTEYNFSYQYQEHPIQIRTINLNQDWRKIYQRLMEIINVREMQTTTAS